MSHWAEPAQDAQASAPAGQVVQMRQLEGPWDVGDPVHETITQEALKQANLIGGSDRHDSPRAWDYTRGIFWNDDPENMLFDSNKPDDFSSGYRYVSRFLGIEKDVEEGKQFGPGTELLGRSHFGDLSLLHGMAGKDGERPEETHGKLLMWSEFATKVALGEIPPDALIGTIQIPGFELLSQDPRLKDKTVGSLFGVGADGGDVRKRAMGSLMHVIQDSYSGGHAEREDLGGNRRGKIKGFHAYSHQDKHDHGEEDAFKGGETPAEMIASMAGGQDSLEQCVAVLKLLNKRGANWDEVKQHLTENTFAMVDNPQVAGPGEAYRMDPHDHTRRSEAFVGLHGDYSFLRGRAGASIEGGLDVPIGEGGFGVGGRVGKSLTDGDFHAVPGVSYQSESGYKMDVHGGAVREDGKWGWTAGAGMGIPAGDKKNINLGIDYTRMPDHYTLTGSAAMRSGAHEMSASATYSNDPRAREVQAGYYYGINDHLSVGGSVSANPGQLDRPTISTGLRLRF